MVVQILRNLRRHPGETTTHRSVVYELFHQRQQGVVVVVVLLMLFVAVVDFAPNCSEVLHSAEVASRQGHWETPSLLTLAKLARQRRPNEAM